MLLTKASEYALLSLIYISQKDVPVDVDTMSGELDISKSFLAKILQNLAREGILVSFKGANGGFMLADKPENISIKKVIESAEKRFLSVLYPMRAAFPVKAECVKSGRCLARYRVKSTIF